MLELMLERTVAKVLLGLFPMALLFSASEVNSQSPKRGGSLSISLEHDLPGLDPLVFASFNEKQAGITVYDTLLDIDAKGKLLPNLAEQFEAAPDATWFKLKLRSGVKFHDGTTFDAAAVVEHFKRLMDPKQRYRWRADLDGIASVEANGPLEVMIKMKAPAAQFLAILADTSGMVPSPTAVQKHGENYLANPDRQFEGRQSRYRDERTGKRRHRRTFKQKTGDSRSRQLGHLVHHDQRQSAGRV